MPDAHGATEPGTPVPVEQLTLGQVIETGWGMATVEAVDVISGKVWVTVTGRLLYDPGTPVAPYRNRGQTPDDAR